MGTEGGLTTGRWSVSKDNLLLDNGYPVKQIAGVDTYSKGLVNTRQFFIVHYTASNGTAEDQTRFCSMRRVSWHITVDRSGHVVQLLSFDKVGWHAGRSSWDCGNGGPSFTSLNYNAVGMEMVNWGWLTEKDGINYSWNGTPVPLDEVHFDNEGKPWQSYTSIQKQITGDIAIAVAKHYNMLNVLGHEDISPVRKPDPGAAYPLRALTQRYESDTGTTCTTGDDLAMMRS